MLITNYWPNPDAVASGRQPTQVLDGTLSWRWGGVAGFALNPKTDSTSWGPYAMFDLTSLPGNTGMVLYAEIGVGTQGNLRGPLMEVATPDDRTIATLPNAYPTSRYNTLQFTTPSDGHVRIKFRGSDSQAVAFYHVYLCTIPDDAIRHSLKLNGFSGNLMPLA